MKPRRGEVWLVDSGEPMGREAGWQRPAVVVSSDYLNEGPSGIVIVVPCTTRNRGLRTHVELDRAGSGLDELSYARCEDMKSVSERRLASRLGQAGPEAMQAISRILEFLLDL